MWQQQLKEISNGNFKTIARCISIIENEAEGFEELLQQLSTSNTPIIGITGAPGAGKSTLTDALIAQLVLQQKKVAVLCVDPSSPFNLGALLGDRIRMSEWYDHPNVYIRSLATRGSLGGLHPHIIEISELLKASSFDYVIIETVGVGQSEIEIAGLADVTVVVVVPEGGDEVHTMKAGLMEIADVFVVNKSDREGADLYVRNLRLMLAPAFHNHKEEVPIVKTVATQREGVEELAAFINNILDGSANNSRRLWLLAQKAFQLIQQKRMRDVNKDELIKQIENAGKEFNLYHFINSYK
jgi:LAO/AO transport system kinase